jgi:DNA invertase Pin-like site-specific DNA recombinase
MTDNIKLGLYARCSTEKQDLIAQKDQLVKHLEYYKTQNPVVYDRWYLDEGYSGTNQKRPKLIQLKKDIENKEINSVIITKLDRLARSVDDLRWLVKFFEENDVKLICLKENIDTSTIQGRLFFNMVSAFIEFERETIIQRMKDGLVYAKSHGSRSGKPCHRPRKNLDMDKIKLMRRQGMSYYAISKVIGVKPQTIKSRLMEIL